MTEYLFVYGTLLAKAKNEMSGFVKSNAVLIGKGYFYGKLFNTGEYPGAVISSNKKDKVYGDIFKINDPKKVFKVLDAYEEVGPHFPEPNEYNRRKITALLYGQKELTCWMYLYNYPTDNLQQIVTGVYPGINNSGF